LEEPKELKFDVGFMVKSSQRHFRTSELYSAALQPLLQMNDLKLPPLCK